MRVVGAVMGRIRPVPDVRELVGAAAAAVVAAMQTAPA